MTWKNIDKMSVRELRAELRTARSDLLTINRTIYAAGAPLGSENYFAIRQIAARYERANHAKD